jgi:GTP-binding protein LepA
MDTRLIRNFSIVAHIDHGKSTLADRLLSHSGSISARETGAQFLDTMDLEQERGITIKARTVRLRYHARDGQDYCLNLIDTLATLISPTKCRAVSLRVRALSSLWTRRRVLKRKHWPTPISPGSRAELLPVINKIDLPSAEPERCAKRSKRSLG